MNKDGLSRISAGGRLFLLPTSIAHQIPLLERMLQNKSLDITKDENGSAVFLDVNPNCFEVIIEYLRSKTFDIPSNISLKALWSTSNYLGLTLFNPPSSDPKSASGSSSKSATVPTSLDPPVRLMHVSRCTDTPTKLLPINAQVEIQKALRTGEIGKLQNPWEIALRDGESVTLEAIRIDLPSPPPGSVSPFSGPAAPHFQLVMTQAPLPDSMQAFPSPRGTYNKNSVQMDPSSSNPTQFEFAKQLQESISLRTPSPRNSSESPALSTSPCATTPSHAASASASATKKEVLNSLTWSQIGVLWDSHTPSLNPVLLSGPAIYRLACVQPWSKSAASKQKKKSKQINIDVILEGKWTESLMRHDNLDSLHHSLHEAHASALKRRCVHCGDVTTRTATSMLSPIHPILSPSHAAPAVGSPLSLQSPAVPMVSPILFEYCPSCEANVPSRLSTSPPAGSSRGLLAPEQSKLVDIIANESVRRSDSDSSMSSPPTSDEDSSSGPSSASSSEGDFDARDNDPVGLILQPVFTFSFWEDELELE